MSVIWQSWIETLKPGDDVAVIYPCSGLLPSIKKVRRVTPLKRVILDNDAKYNKSGFEIGRNSLYTIIRPVTAELEAKIKNAKRSPIYIRRNDRNTGF